MAATEHTATAAQAGTSHQARALEHWRSHTGQNDILTGLRATHVWLALGWHDIRQRYRRSVLGPFWFTLTTLIMVGVLGFLYSTLFKQEVSDYLPYLGIGMVVWQFISTAANEGCTVMIGAAQVIKQIRMPLSAHVCRMTWRNFIILLHSLPVVVVLMLFFGHAATWQMLLLIPGLLLLLLNAVWSGIVFGILCARYRDVAPIIGNLFQVGFFLTPVMWRVDALQHRAWVAHLNPFHHLIEIVRGPILGVPVALESWLWAFGLLVLGFAFAQYLMVRCRERVAYWL
ncbi:ABC transporter permease [Uliginosibacterium sp. 31-12]|uniref:ABC transporter permease n=1 Tax=Uliginosibacterium sp. 31-12 TaxID=3062781 RepID=UPI0026E293E1|nr:ABC transporter permease [Uliginosibacterium sp. 31-12]MDO6388180.1 ABC transporter permease [Uliginosibacterium sp. 31-12]